MTAGKGIRHSEKNDEPAVNPATDRPVELVQMWVVPDEAEVNPGYEQLELDPQSLRGQLALVASGMVKHRDDAAIRIGNRYAAFYVARLEPGESVTVPDAPFVHLYVPRGQMELEDGPELGIGDAARLTAAGSRRLTAREGGEVLLWEMHASLAPAR